MPSFPMRPPVALVAFVALLSVVLTQMACAERDCTNTGTCEGVGDGSGDDAVTPTGCDVNTSIADAPSCVDDAVGVFVSSAGADSAAGSKVAPVKTITKALALAGERGVSRVYVCEGTYAENVTVANAVGLYGGLTCAWAPSATARPKIAPASGVALTVAKVNGPVVVEDVDAEGLADEKAPGDSAIAARVSESTVTFRRVGLKAGNGTKGADGAGRSNYDGVATKGGDANGATAGAGPTCTCVDGTSSKGGNGAAGAGNGVTPGESTPVAGATNSGASNFNTCGDGTAGANATAGGAGEGQNSSGYLTSDGWTSLAKTSSSPNGNPAQGGGGGGAKTQSGTAAGGGGACGGCGGAGGASGANGGATFGLIAFNATVTVDGGTLVTSSGGAGGSGAAGQAGQAGGTLGVGACNGGPGGHGAGGSGGGGGAGGHSAPIAYVGNAPIVTNATLTPGTPGPAGPGGKPGAGPGAPGTPGTPGSPGQSVPTLKL